MILDASAFYAGVPFGSSEAYSTTPQVYGEISHIKRAQDVAGALQEMGRLGVFAPDDAHVEKARAAASYSGDLPEMSEQDVSVLALALQTGQDIITDDYALSNAAHHAGVRAHHIMTKGPAVKGRWRYRCPACRRARPPGRRCNACGTRLRRRLHKP